MAVSVPIPRLGPNALKYLPEKPAFVHLTAAHLGNAGTEKDGFDVMARAVMHSLADEPAIGKVLDKHLAAADFVPGALSKGIYSPIATALATLHTDGDKLLKDLGDAITGTPNNPNGGSGSGGSGGSGGGHGGGSGGGGGGGGEGGGGGGGGGDPGGGCGGGSLSTGQGSGGSGTKQDSLLGCE